MISAGKIRYKMIRNFQIIAFFDAGSAWHGRTPYSPENVINTLTLESPPAVVVNVKYFRDPLIYGYGIGARTSFFGYFVKLDYGWGVETRIVQKPRLYLSFGLDF
jgi:outer membrane translocation and assembly module TamA